MNHAEESGVGLLLRRDEWGKVVSVTASADVPKGVVREVWEYGIDGEDH